MNKSCQETTKNKIFTFQEAKSKLSLYNKDLIESTKIKVDGCEINDNGIRCDYLHIAKNIEMYIELKGQDINHAIKQIERSIDILSKDKKKQEKKCYIITTRTPLAGPEIQKIGRIMKSKYNVNLIIKSSPFDDIY